MRSIGGHKIEPSPLHVRWEPVRISLLALAVGWLIRKTAQLLWVIARSPVAMTAITIAVAAGHLWSISPWADIAIAVAVAAGLFVLRRRRPVLFNRWVVVRLRSGWRRFWVYRHRWPASMDTAGLNVTRAGTQHLPVLGKVSSSGQVDRVRVRMLPGQTMDDWAKVADRLCQTFGALDCRVRTVPKRVHELELWFLVVDPLAETVPPVPAVAPVRWDALPVGLREDGQPYRLQLRNTHVLCVGATGAGKGSVLWSIITQLVPGVCDGTVRLWALDPKGGMELAAGEAVFDRFVHGDTDTGKGFEEHFAQVLEDAVIVMRRRQTALRGITRLLEPTAADPLIVVLVDELAALTGYIGDRDLKRRIGNALSLLLSQGRAVGVCVVAAVQDPRKETIPARDLFPTRIALRLNEAEQVHLVLGPGARDKGARCDQIPESLPGVGYVQVDGIGEPVRVRFAHVTDDHIRASIHASPLFAALGDGTGSEPATLDHEGRAAA